MQHLSPASSKPTLVIALHCSGAGAGQWRQLAETLGYDYRVIAPEYYGCVRVGSWAGAHAFTLVDEAVGTIELIGRNDDKVHLVGHAYGGGVEGRGQVSPLGPAAEGFGGWALQVRHRGHKRTTPAPYWHRSLQSGREGLPLT